MSKKDSLVQVSAHFKVLRFLVQHWTSISILF